MAAVLMSPETGLKPAAVPRHRLFARCGGQRGRIIVCGIVPCNGFVGSSAVFGAGAHHKQEPYENE